MYSKTAIFILILLSPMIAFSSHPEHSFKKCFFDELRELQQVSNKNHSKSLDSMEQILLGNTINLLNQPLNSQLKMINTLTIPVVFHIIHENGNENISDAQINDVLGIINDGFSHGGSYNTGLGVNTNIQFCLASEDELGNASTGINRIQNALTNMDLADELAVKNLSRWDPLKYLNIWVVKSIGGGSIAGFSYLANNHGSLIDGVLIDDNYVSYNESNTAILVHEIGHYCNLYHTFEGGCFNDDCMLSGDKVCDTAPDNDTFQGPNCGSYNSCTTDADDISINNPFSADENDMDYLFMDYSFYNCFSAFTQGQADRMYNSLLSFRSSLFMDNPCNTNLSNNTDEEDLTISFYADKFDICENENITFTSSSNQSNLLYNWSFVGAMPATSTSPNPTVSYLNQGVFNASLTVTNLAGQTADLTEFNYINVNDAPNAPTINGNTQYCEGDPFTALQAFGSNLTWIDAVNNTTYFGNSFLPTEASTIFVFDALNGCESEFTLVDISVTETPDNPTITGETIFCDGEDYSNILAFGNNVQWFDIGNNSIVSGNIYAPVSTTNLLVTQVINNCESSATQVEVVIVPKPDVPFVSGKLSYCENEDFEPLNAVGTDINWFDISNTINHSGSDFTPISEGTIFVSQTINGCESNYFEIDVEVNDTTFLEFVNLNLNNTNSMPVVLEALPSGGTFTGDAVFIDTFNPSLVNGSSSLIFYAYTNAFGCTSTVSETVQTANQAQTVGTHLHTVNPLLPTLQLGILKNSNNVSNFIDIFINNINSDNARLVISDLNGRLHYNEVLSIKESYSDKIPIKGYTNGVYLVSISTENGRVTKKIMQ